MFQQQSPATKPSRLPASLLPGLPPGLPIDPFSTFIPTEAEPWNVARVAHLYRRAAFGPTRDQVEQASSSLRERLLTLC